MKKKTPKVVQFIEGLHEFVTTQSHLFNKSYIRSKIQAQDIIGTLVFKYLEEYFSKAGYKDAISKANDALYWEGKESEHNNETSPIFGERSSPDFKIDDPYSIAIVYRQSNNGSVFKQGIGQSLIYTLSGEFNFVYYLFHDQTRDKKIERSTDYKLESSIIADMWDHHNIKVKFI